MFQKNSVVDDTYGQRILSIIR